MAIFVALPYGQLADERPCSYTLPCQVEAPASSRRCYTERHAACLCSSDPAETKSGTHLRTCAGMCRAHGIAHQRVTERGGLEGALKAAWRLNTHSVVEVITQPGSANVQHHRRIQDSARRAVLRALQPVSPLTGSPCLEHWWFGDPSPAVNCAPHVHRNLPRTLLVRCRACWVHSSLLQLASAWQGFPHGL